MTNPPETNLSIVLSDSNAMSCELLGNALEQASAHFKVVARALTVGETVAAVTNQVPRLALISAALQDGRLAGYQALRDIRATGSTTRIVMLLDAPDRELVTAAFCGGARGVYFRADSITRLTKCIHTVDQGQIWASNTELEYLLQALITAVPLARNVPASRNAVLTSREQQIVELIARGLTNREICHEMHISEHTVKNYVFRIFDKLGVSNRVELAIYYNNSRFESAA